MLEKYLQEIGLNEKEAGVYLALLQVDSASVVDIAEKTKIKRPTVYVVLETLAKKGLVSEVEIGKKTHYAAEPPERLETFVERQQLILGETAKRLKDIIPQMKSVQRELGERPVLKYFDGKEAAFHDSLAFFPSGNESKEDTGYFAFNRDLIEEAFSQREIETIAKDRPARKIKAVSVYNYSKQELPSDSLSDRTRVDAKDFPIKCDLSVYEDRVQFVTLGKRISSIFIQSRDVADTLKTLIKLAKIGAQAQKEQKKAGE
ncbi:MAG: helix-turn-helix domain-containing protein [Patescibacteria group bacterium]